MSTITRRTGHVGLVLCAVLTVGCAFDLTDVKYQSARLESAGDAGASFALAAETPIDGAPCGYARSLRKGTRREAIGRIAEGVVYRSREQTLTVECSNVFEAYLVVAGQRLVGFYLPVEKGFSPLGEPIPLVVSPHP